MTNNALGRAYSTPLCRESASRDLFVKMLSNGRMGARAKICFTCAVTVPYRRHSPMNRLLVLGEKVSEIKTLDRWCLEFLKPCQTWLLTLSMRINYLKRIFLKQRHDCIQSLHYQEQQCKRRVDANQFKNMRRKKNHSPVTFQSFPP